MIEETQKMEIEPEPIEKKGGGYLLTGLILGLLLGLIYTWFINPTVYYDLSPARLAEQYQDTYRSSIAQVFAATGNLERAELRIGLLDDPDPVFSLGIKAQSLLAEGRTDEAHAHALLASALMADGAQPMVFTQTAPSEPTSTAFSQGIPTQTLPVLTPIP